MEHTKKNWMRSNAARKFAIICCENDYRIFGFFAKRTPNHRKFCSSVFSSQIVIHNEVLPRGRGRGRSASNLIELHIFTANNNNFLLVYRSKHILNLSILELEDVHWTFLLDV